MKYYNFITINYNIRKRKRPKKNNCKVFQLLFQPLSLLKKETWPNGIRRIFQNMATMNCHFFAKRCWQMRISVLINQISVLTKRKEVEEEEITK